jgi:hypothetical protein
MEKIVIEMMLPSSSEGKEDLASLRPKIFGEADLQVW